MPLIYCNLQMGIAKHKIFLLKDNNEKVLLTGVFLRSVPDEIYRFGSSLNINEVVLSGNKELIEKVKKPIEEKGMQVALVK